MTRCFCMNFAFGGLGYSAKIKASISRLARLANGIQIVRNTTLTLKTENVKMCIVHNINQLLYKIHKKYLDNVQNNLLSPKKVLY